MLQALGVKILAAGSKEQWVLELPGQVRRAGSRNATSVEVGLCCGAGVSCETGVHDARELLKREEAEVGAANGQHQCQPRELLYQPDEPEQARLPKRDAMPLVEGIYGQYCPAISGLSCGVERAEEVGVGDLGQIKLTTDLLPGVTIGEASAEDQDEGTSCLKLLVSEVSDEVGFADAAWARDDQFPLVHELPALARNLIADTVDRRVEVEEVLAKEVTALVGNLVLDLGQCFGDAVDGCDR